MRKVVLILLINMFIFGLTSCKRVERKILYKPKFNVVGFYVDQKGDTSSYTSLVKYFKYMNVLSPTWLAVEKTGDVTDTTSSNVLRFAKKNGLKVVPLVNVVDSNDEVLLNPGIRDKAISNIVALIKKYNFDGVNIDFEFIPHGQKEYIQDKDYMTNFMSLLEKRVKPMGKVLDVSVIPRYHVSQSISGIYDYHALAPVVDHVTLMTYDRHYETSPPGPVSPLEWVDQNIKYALNQGFKPNQICLGVATYGYNWPVNASGGFSEPTKTIMQKANSLGVRVKWSQTYQEPYYEYYDQTLKGTREIWFENSATLDEKIKLAKKYKLHGICIWRLGFETPDFWNVIAKNR